MQQALRRSSLVPRGFLVESVYYEGDKARYCSPRVRKRWSVSTVRNGFPKRPQPLSTTRDRFAAIGGGSSSFL